jgi:hypothetical protein
MAADWPGDARQPEKARRRDKAVMRFLHREMHVKMAGEEKHRDD